MKHILMFAVLLVLGACGTSNNNGDTSPETFNCQNPVGGIVLHGQSITLYKNLTVTHGQVCETEVRTCNNGTLSGSAINASCAVLPEQEPISHEQPLKYSDEGLKMGGVRTEGVVSKYVSTDYDNMFSPKPKLENIVNCSNDVVVGGTCVNNYSVCKKQREVFSCNTSTNYKVWGWIYEKNGLDYSKMAENVKVDIYSFALCVGDSRGCGSFAGPVLTDKFGYFELNTSTLFDTLRIDGLPKYYMFCNKGKPIAGGGQYLAGSADKAIGPFKQLINGAGVCDQNLVMKLFAEEKAPANTNDLNKDYK